MKPVVGLGLIGAGVFFMYGGITGRLAPMIAAMFTPKYLQPSSGGTSSALSQAENDAGLNGGGPNLSPFDFLGPLGQVLK